MFFFFGVLRIENLTNLINTAMIQKLPGLPNIILKKTLQIKCRQRLFSATLRNYNTFKILYYYTVSCIVIYDNIVNSFAGQIGNPRRRGL